MIEWTEIIARLGIATVAGGLLGLNRDLHHKPVGVRTLGLVGLATAIVIVLADGHSDTGKFTDATSRVIQGVLTGIGFIGAGVIVHTERHSRVHGLTSAACAWFAACIGIISGAGEWRLVLIGLAMAFALLLLGGPFERALHRFRMSHHATPIASDTGGETAHLKSQNYSSEDGPHQPGR
jgi:putative Mg2+ transporter-C (MgtC) family protein